MKSTSVGVGQIVTKAEKAGAQCKQLDRELSNERTHCRLKFATQEECKASGQPYDKADRCAWCKRGGKL